MNHQSDHSLLDFFIVVTCPIPPNLSNGWIQFQYGSVVNGGYTVSTLATFFCNNGYSRSSNFVQLLCRQMGMWSHPFPTCNQSNLTVILNYAKKENISVQNFQIYLENVLRVLKIHKASEQYFVIVTCSALTLSNGGISYNQSEVNGRYTVDTKATFSCNSGYTRAGSSSSTCQTSGHWSPQIPTCNQSNEFDILVHKYCHQNIKTFFSGNHLVIICHISQQRKSLDSYCNHIYNIYERKR